MQNIRNARMRNASEIIPLEEKIKKIVSGMQSPIKEENLIAGDGGAWRAYNFQLLKPHKTLTPKPEQNI